MRATVISDQAECDRIWALADRVFAPYATYRREAAKVNRTIPIVQLTPEVTFWNQEEGWDRRGSFGRLSRPRREERPVSPARTEIGRVPAGAYAPLPGPLMIKNQNAKIRAQIAAVIAKIRPSAPVRWS
jgi:hypothetical protein